MPKLMTGLTGSHSLYLQRETLGSGISGPVTSLSILAWGAANRLCLKTGLKRSIGRQEPALTLVISSYLGTRPR